MKKVAFLSLILILLAVAVVPVMAAGNPHGNGNGNSAGQGNGGGNQNQGQINKQNRSTNANNGARGNGNQQQKRMRTPFYLQGTISAIDTTAMTMTVTLTHGNAQVKQFIGETLGISTTNTTMIFKITQGDETGGETDEDTAKTAAPTTSTETENDEGTSNRVPIPFDQLAVGQYVAIHGNLVDGVFTARLITEYFNTTIGQPVSPKP